jgi:hypothetical protein
MRVLATETALQRCSLTRRRRALGRRLHRHEMPWRRQRRVSGGSVEPAVDAEAGPSRALKLIGSSDHRPALAFRVVLKWRARAFLSRSAFRLRARAPDRARRPDARSAKSHRRVSGFLLLFCQHRRFRPSRFAPQRKLYWKRWPSLAVPGRAAQLCATRQY